MKKVCLLSLILILGIWGCSNGVGPVSDDSKMESITESASSDLSKKGDKTGLTVSGLIKAKKSSYLIMDTYYERVDEKGKCKKVEVEAKIKFPSKCVDEDVIITMTYDPASMMFIFSPSMKFSKDAKLDVKIKGLDLKEVDKKDINFVYYTVDGEEVYLKHSNIGINKRKGELKVDNIKIRHFSRFGFTR